MTKKSYSTYFLLLNIISTFSYSQLPELSPLAETKQRLEMVDVSIRYSRPSVQGRIIWGGLVPYDTIWRAGANASTVLSTSDTIFIRNKIVPPGRYSVLIIPSKDQWTWILNKDTQLSAGDFYNSAKNILQFETKPTSCLHHEHLTYSFDSIQRDQMNLSMYWETKVIRLPISVRQERSTRLYIQDLIAKHPNAATLNNIARNHIDFNRNSSDAIKLAEQSVTMERAFWNLMTLSMAHAMAGHYEEAIRIAEESMNLAQKQGYPSFVRENKNNIQRWRKLSLVNK